MNPIQKRALIGTLGIVSLTFVAYVAVIICMLFPPLRSFSRRHEKLPSVSVENGHTVCCRMRYCDFRFPLPENVNVVRIDRVTGGLDTIEGTIHAVDANGGLVKMRNYAELLQRHHFDSISADSFGFFTRSINQEGGVIAASSAGRGAEIHFSYFGDD